MRIYSDRRFLPQGIPHVPLLYAFWGPNSEPSSDPTSGRFDAWTSAGKSIFEETEIARADVAVLPASWENLEGLAEGRDLAREFAELAREYEKPLVVFYWSDSDDPVPLEGSIVFRTSLYRSRRRDREFALPAWSEDFLERYLNSTIPLRAKTDVPIVGFCGFSDPLTLKGRTRSFARTLLRTMGLRESPSGLAVRQRALRYLYNEPRITTNFVLRSRFLGGTDSSTAPAEAMRIRKEFVRNIVEADYVLCVRGAGNFSYRLYETLSCGRIPIFVDTDCVLPYDFEVDWKNYCVWVRENELKSISDKLLEFHSGLTSDEFEQLQRSCRKLWEERLSPQGFFSVFHRHF